METIKYTIGRLMFISAILLYAAQPLFAQSQDKSRRKSEKQMEKKRLAMEFISKFKTSSGNLSITSLPPISTSSLPEASHSINIDELRNHNVTDANYVKNETPQALVVTNSNRSQRAASTVIASTTTNAALIAVARTQGWIEKTATQMTEGDAAKVTEIPYLCFYNNTDITSFDEFQYFTSCTDIGIGAFLGCSNLKSIILPSSITKLGYMSFAKCGFSTFKIPANVNSIGNAILAECPNLVSIESAASWLTVVNGALIANSKFIIAYPAKRSNTSYSCSSTIERIREYAFSGNTYLKTITFSSSLTEIEDDAFSGCSSLSLTSLPVSLTTLGEYAFQGCNISSVSIGANVTSIGTAPFNNNKTLEAINVNSNNTYYASVDGVLYTKDKKTLIQYPAARSASTYDIDENVDIVGERAFVSASNLTKLSIPISTDSIGNYAFINISKLTDVYANMVKPMPINENCFYPIYSSATLHVPEGTSSVYKATPYWSQFVNIKESSSTDDIIATSSSNSALIAVAQKQGWIASTATQMTKADAAKVTKLNKAFQSNKDITSLKELQYFTGLTSIDTDDFEFCSKLMEVMVPEGVQTIAPYAFFFCDSLESISLPSTLSSIEGRAFADCYRLKNITLNQANATYTLRSGVLFNKAMTTLVYCPAAQTSVSIPSTVTTIGKAAFMDGSLTSVTLPSSVTVLEERCFYGNNLTSVSMSSKLTTIGEYAFAFSELKNVQLPSNLNIIGNNAFYYTDLTTITIPASVTSIGTANFGGCSLLTNISVNSGNSYYASVDGVLFNKDKTNLISFPGAKSEVYSIPEGTKTISEEAFYSNKLLTSITLPASITSIGSSAFNGFGINLTEVIAKMTSPCMIAENTFFSDTYESCSLRVPSGCVSTYKATQYWNKFNSIVEISNDPVSTFVSGGVTYAINGNNATIISVGSQYDDVVIPSTVIYNSISYTVTAVAEQAMASDDGFNLSVSFPSTITTIAAKAFDKAQTTAIIWNSNTALPSNAFANVDMNTWKNMLLYVNKSGIAPTSFTNTIINGVANNIELHEGCVFHCPQEFTANKISFTHEFTMQTVVGKTQGWETIALPFDVMSITHAVKGRVIPFASYSPSSPYKPFWLYEWTNQGFAKATTMQANTPYIISMPNNPIYSSDYNLVGSVTFSSTNAIVKTTKNEDIRSNSYQNKYFWAEYYYMSATDNYANINSVNSLHDKTGNYDPGSIFIKNLRSTCPFEGYMYEDTSSSNAHSVIEIIFADEETLGIEALPMNEVKPIYKLSKGIYTMDGRRIAADENMPTEDVLKTLPAGIYIVNGKKHIVK